jgi:hypothetical protein
MKVEISAKNGKNGLTNRPQLHLLVSHFRIIRADRLRVRREEKPEDKPAAQVCSLQL